MVNFLWEGNGRWWIQLFYSRTYVVPGRSLSWKEKCRKCLCPQRILKIAVELLNWNWFWCLTVEGRREISRVNWLLPSWTLPCLLFLYSQFLFRILHSACNAKWIILNRKSNYVSINNKNNKKNQQPKPSQNFLYLLALLLLSNIKLIETNGKTPIVAWEFKLKIEK